MSVPVSNEVIDNTNYSYFAYFVLPVSQPYYPPHSETFVGVSVQIKYQPPSFMFLPVVRK